MMNYLAGSDSSVTRVAVHICGLYFESLNLVSRVTFTAVAIATGISRTTLYRDPQIVALIIEHCVRATEASTLTGLVTDIGHLGTSVEAIAERIRNHEERLRSLEGRHRTGTPN